VKLCTVLGCENERFAKRLCRMHYARLLRGRPLEPIRFQSKLTAEQVAQIKAGKNKRDDVENAKRFGVSWSYCFFIRKGKRVPKTV
jgi:hypothetical protein